jgi:hypothetical protein
MSATLTWSENHGESAAQSTFGATNQGAIQLMNQHFTALAAFSDFPWTVCSHEGTTAPWYVTLKRKSGAAGRIVFIAVASAPGVTYNPQLGSLSWSSAGVRAAYFPAATSDTPANILATSGDVFTNPAGSTGGGPSQAMTSGTTVFNAFACADGIFMRYGPSNTDATGWIIVGALAEDGAGVEAGISAHFPGAISTNPASTPNVSTNGAYMMPAGVSIQYGTGWAPTSSPAGFLRDNGAKKAWFLPRSLASFMVTGDAVFKYKLRQIAIGPTPLAAHERLATVGDVLAAQSASASVTADRPWLTNFQV